MVARVADGPAVSVAAHRADVVALIADLGRGADGRPRTELLEPLAALDRVLAVDVVAPLALPSFRNSQMDGYAVHAGDLAGAAPEAAVRLPVVAEIPAAAGVPAALPPGAAARIMTGAPLPAGADAVVPVEDTDDPGFALGSPPPWVGIRRAREVGAFIRATGSDIGAGEIVVPTGTTIAPRHVAAMAACGIERVAVVAAPRVAVISTGSELAVAGSVPEPGEVFESNSVALTAAVQAAGGRVTFRTWVPDDREQAHRVLAAAAAAADLILTTGGVSKGAYEVIRETVADDATFRTVAMQPGGPQGFGRVAGVPLLAFPGNPVSAMVSFVVFARAALERAAGRPDRPVPAPRPLSDAGASPAGKVQFLRGVRTPDGGVRLVGGQGSHLVASMARADVLIEIPADVERWPAGQPFALHEL